VSVRLPGAALADLEGLIGSHRVTQAPGVRLGGVQPSAEVWVADAGELADVMSIALEARLSVCTIGGGTKSGWGAPPTVCDILVRTRPKSRTRSDSPSVGAPPADVPMTFAGPLVKITEYDPDNLTVTVGAGAAVADVAAFAAQDGLVLPLDPSGGPAATIGGVLSTNDHGPHRLSRGGNRDVVLGVAAVLMGGERVKGGGRTIKNVTGYDLTRLFVGSFGSLGVLTEATIRLLPAPRCERVLVCPHADLDGAFRFVRALRSTQLLPAALEVISPAAGRLADEEALGIVGPGGHTVVIAFEGEESAVDRQVRDTLALLGAGTGIVLAVERPIGTLWAVLGRLREAGRRAGYPIEAKITAPPAALPEVLGAFEAGLGPDGMWTASAAVGTAHVWLGSPERLGTTPAEFAPALLETRSAAVRVGGSLTLVEGSHAVGPTVDAWGPPPDGLSVMRALKDRFDPWGLLNPGRFVGGI
jgi:glycolate oxidase FAD binding subunit